MFAFTCLAFLATTGCETPVKETWSDWIAAADEARQSAIVSSSAVADRTSSDSPAVVFVPSYESGDGARVGSGFDLGMRNPDFPNTYIETIHLDLASPDHAVRLVWCGPLAKGAPVGPWRSCPGRGKPGVNCDDAVASNVVDSFCTPKGIFAVAGFSDHLHRATTCYYATWVLHAPRYVAMHSHGDIATHPRSEGCIRLTNEVAKLIHNNSRAGLTMIHIGGRWTRGEQAAP